jgi:hypothetical protein
MEGHMGRLVPQHETDSLIERAVLHAAVDHLIVRRADHFRREQHLDFEVKTAGAAGELEKPVRPMAPHQPAAQSLHQMREQAGVLGLFPDEKPECPYVVLVAGARCFLEQEASAAGLAELKMGERDGQAATEVFRKMAGPIPVRFRPVEAIGEIMSNPAGGFTLFHKVVRHSLTR